MLWAIPQLQLHFRAPAASTSPPYSSPLPPILPFPNNTFTSAFGLRQHSYEVNAYAQNKLLLVKLFLTAPSTSVFKHLEWPEEPTLPLKRWINIFGFSQGALRGRSRPSVHILDQKGTWKTWHLMTKTCSFPGLGDQEPIWDFLRPQPSPPSTGELVSGHLTP